MQRFYARYSPRHGGGYAGWGVFFRPDDVFVWVKRDVTAQKIAEAVAEVLNAVIPYERDTHAQAQELRRKLGPISDF